MKKSICLSTMLLLLCFVSITTQAQDVNIKQLILQQIKNTHNNKAWFVPFNEAVKGLSPKQAAEKIDGNHSVGQLVHHIHFWTEHNLNNFKNDTTIEFTGNNEDTFDEFEQKEWHSLVRRTDIVLSELEEWVENATDEQIQKYIKPLTNLAMHNAYHIGQIISVKKALGFWKK